MEALAGFLPPLRMLRWLLFALVAAAPAAAAQAYPDALGPAPRLYGGAALGPGLGAVVEMARPVGDLLAVEALVAVDYTPRVVGGAGRLLTSVGLGGSVRLARVAAEWRRTPPSRADLDVGLRLGPAFYTGFYEPTAASEARAFRVMSDAFVRGTLRLASRRVVFAEVGTQAPALRGGLAMALRGRRAGPADGRPGEAP